MRVLVTGGTGYLGRAIVRALAERGHRAVVFARSASRSGLPGHAVDADIRDAAALRRAAEGCDAVCHTAALVSMWRARRQDFDDVNIQGFVNTLAAAHEARARRIVYTSSFLARPPAGAREPLASNDYQRTKAVAAAMARAAQQAGSPLVILYPGVIYGPGILTEGNLLGRMLADHFAGRLPGLIGPHRVWSYAWVEEVARAHVAAIEHPSPAPEYALGGEDAPQIRPFEIARQLRGGRLPRRVPYALASCVGAVEEWRARLTSRPPRLTLGTVDLFRHDWPVESARAARDLGYAVRPLAEGIDALLRSNEAT